MNLLERLFPRRVQPEAARVEVDEPAPCKNWTGTVQPSVARTVVWEYFGRVRPQRSVVLAMCGNPACIEITHLGIGTRSDAMKLSERQRQEHRPRGAAISTKLNDHMVVSIRNLYAEGTSVDILSRIYGVSDAQVRSITLGRSWRHVGGPRTRRRGYYKPRSC